MVGGAHPTVPMRLSPGLRAVKNVDSENLDVKLSHMNTTDSPASLDRVDAIIAGWRAAHPDLDPSPLEVVGRAIVLGRHLEQSVNAALEKHQLTLGQFDILATLRRHDPKGGLPPRELLKSVVLSSGGMTARLDALEEAGLIARRADADDRRMVKIELTAKGRKVIDAATATRFAEARASLPNLTPEELETLTGLLRRWLGQIPR